MMIFLCVSHDITELFKSDSIISYLNLAKYSNMYLVTCFGAYLEKYSQIINMHQ